MGSSIDVPSVVRRVDSNLQTVVSSAWARRNQNQWWRRVVRTRPSSTGIEHIQWLLETAKLRKQGNGGRNVYGDRMAVNFSIENEQIGDSLILTANEMLDALGSQNNTGNALDYAAQWGREVGNQGAYWPQLSAAQFLTGSTSVTSYDGLSFFNEAHWVNAATKAGSTFANVFYGVPFNTQNYAAIGSYIETIPGPDGIPRKVKPRIALFGSDNRFNAMQAFDARSTSFTDPNNASQGAAADNMTRTLYDTEAPVVDADLTMTGQDRGTWWIAGELMEDDQLAGMIFQEREPFRLNSYTEFTDVQLAHADSYEWKFKGRNKFSAGHPFLLFKCVPYVPAGKTQFVAP